MILPIPAGNVVRIFRPNSFSDVQTCDRMKIYSYLIDGFFTGVVML